MPTAAILTSSVVGFLCVIAAAVSPDTVFSFLLNSSGAIILFVYLLIAISQLILRRRTSPEKLTVKMWLFPFLTIATIVAILAVLVLMFFKEDTRSQLVLSLLAWAVVLVLYALTKWRGGSVGKDFDDAAAGRRHQGAGAGQRDRRRRRNCSTSCGRSTRRARREYFVCVPANPVDTGQAEHTGAVWVWEETTKAAQARLDATLADPARRRVCTPKASSATTGRLHALADGGGEVQARTGSSSPPIRRCIRPGCGRTSSTRPAPIPGHPDPAHRVHHRSGRRGRLIGALGLIRWARPDRCDSAGLDHHRGAAAPASWSRRRPRTGRPGSRRMAVAAPISGVLARV